MRTRDPAWLQEKLDALKKTNGAGFDLAMPPDGGARHVGSAPAALAHLVEYRARRLGYLSDATEESPMLLALASRKEPKAEQEGSLAYYVDVKNPATNDDLTLFLKEATMADGTRFPFSVWMAGRYPKEWDGLLKLLSLDMRISDVQWVSRKLKGLLDLPEAKGDFWAPVPGTDKKEVYPSTLAYIARVILHRYQMLGLIDATFEPIRQSGLFLVEAVATPPMSFTPIGPGIEDCTACGGRRTVGKRDGCRVCDACGNTAGCG
jgi:ribonucleoside-diphosphate reductase alpha chain